jgi:hypothetical protein
MSLIHLLYVSVARADLQEREIAEILTSARNNNPRLGVTGMLLFAKGTFLQVIEGPHRHMDALFRRIAADPRHSVVQCLARREIDARRFPNWSMGFRQIEMTDAEGAQAFALTEKALCHGLGASDVEALSLLVDRFCSVSGPSFADRASA